MTIREIINTILDFPIPKFEISGYEVFTGAITGIVIALLLWCLAEKYG